MDRYDDLKLDIDWVLGRVERLEAILGDIIRRLEYLERRLNLEVGLIKEDINHLHRELDEIRKTLKHE